MTNTSRTIWLKRLALLAVIVLLPMLVRPVVAAEILIFAIAGMALNLIFGYAGMLSFGQATFFGMGAYTAGLMLIHWKAPLLIVLAAGTLIGAVTAAAIGIVCIQRAGVYFTMLTFGFNQIFYFAAYKWTDLTGGDDGLPGIVRPLLSLGPLSISLEGSVPFYAFIAVLFVVTFYVMRRIVESPLGLICQTIRDNEARAAAIGYNVTFYKWLIFTMAGAFTAFAGVLYSLMFGIVPIDVISWITSGDILLMVLLGGMGHFYGPLVGAGVFKSLSEAVAVMWHRWPLILGLVLMLVVLFLRGGLVDLASRTYQLTFGRRYGDPRQADRRS
jgi:branched-chain amino acid transport system permease protein